MGRLDDIKARADNATPGPWEVKEESKTDGGVPLTEKWVHAPAWMRLIVRAASNYPAVTHRGGQDFADMAFIAHARADIPWLLSEVERLQAALSQIANRPDEEMQAARTLHYDMRGWAKAALEETTP